jgi:hypothetical protein
MKLFLSTLTVCLTAGFAVSSTASAATIYYDKAAFLAASGSLAFESLEGLTPTNSVTAGFSQSLADFSILASPFGGVFNAADYFGTHATHGANFIEVEGGTQQSVTFLFAAPVNAFGVTITDYGDISPGAMTFTANNGAFGVAAAGARPNANEQFFGLISPSPDLFGSVTLKTAIGPFGDAFSVDGVYFTPPPSSVPEPATLTMLAYGGACLAITAVRRRRR